MESSRDDADQLDLALLDQFAMTLRCDQLRLAGAEHVSRHPARLAVAELDPLVYLGPVLVVELVDVVREVDQLPLLVVEGDVEVARVHQLADDGVNRPVELLQVLRRARELRDAVERGLHLLRAGGHSACADDIG